MILVELNKFNLSFDASNFDEWQACSIPDQVYARKCSMNDSPLQNPNGVTYEDARFVFFDTLAFLSYHELNTTQQRRFSAGLLVKEMMNNIDRAISGEEKSKRFFFFSAHDTTIYPSAERIWGVDRSRYVATFCISCRTRTFGKDGTSHRMIVRITPWHCHTTVER